MLITSAELNTWVGAYIWPMFRIGAMLMAAPVFGARTVPIRVRIGLMLAITFVVAPMLDPVPVTDPLSPVAVLIIIQQVLIGVLMGFALQMVMSAVVMGGQVVSMQMGLGFSVMVDPQNGAQTPVISQFYLLMVTLVFLVLNGHLVLIEVLVDSFRTMPISQESLQPESLWQLLSWGSSMFAGAVGMALPAIASLLVVNFAFGIMTRSSPQLNIFAIGFPITIMIGFAVILVTLPSMLPQAEGMFNSIYAVLRQLATGGA